MAKAMRAVSSRSRTLRHSSTLWNLVMPVATTTGVTPRLAKMLASLPPALTSVQKGRPQDSAARLMSCTAGSSSP